MTDCLSTLQSLNWDNSSGLKIFLTTPPAMFYIQGKARKLEQYSNAECTVCKEWHFIRDSQ